jgi:superoxide dismutase, Fe-Mn family
MQKFVAKTFKIPTLKGLSAKNIEEHLKLYSGYVNYANQIQEKIAELKQDMEKNACALGEINRRFGFEYNGLRNHEAYFSAFEGGAKHLKADDSLRKMIAETWGSFDAWLMEFKAIALTRGVGWAMLYYDRSDNRLLNVWIDEQHIGQLQNCALILGLDMWEHSFVYDYQPSGKKNYIEDFFVNLNWEVIDGNLKNVKQ